MYNSLTKRGDMLNSNSQNLDNYQQTFPYKGQAIYALIFKRHPDKIKIGKEKFAVPNLEKIFTATFKLVPKMGFQAMSLRDLSTETGLSMGGIYSSISNKENIALIVKDIVELVCQDIVANALDRKTPDETLQTLVRGYLYSATLLQPWFYFLFFETRSLPPHQQESSKQIERDQVTALTAAISTACQQHAQHHASSAQPEFVATMILAMIQERYIKHWKYQQPTQTIDTYADHCLELIQRLSCKTAPQLD